MVRAERSKSMRPASSVYADLNVLFARFNDRPSGMERGGFARRGVPYHSKDHTGSGGISFGDPPPGYHLEQSFTREEMPWIHQVTARLTAIAKGGFIPDVAGVQMEGVTEIAQPLSLAKRFEARALGGALKTETVYDVLEQTVLEDVLLFAERYPYLLPALDAMFAVAGIDGTKAALSLSHIASPSQFFKLVAGGDGEEIHTSLFRKDHGREKKQGILPRVKSALHVWLAIGGIKGFIHFLNILIHSNTYEVACLGQNYGQELEKQFVEGIRLLGQHGTVADMQDSDDSMLFLDNGTIITSENLAPRDRDIRPKMEALVAQLRQQAEATLSV